MPPASARLMLSTAASGIKSCTIRPSDHPCVFIIVTAQQRRVIYCHMCGHKHAGQTLALVTFVGTSSFIGIPNWRLRWCTALPQRPYHTKAWGVVAVHTRRCIHKAVHTQGGAHRRRSVATVGVLLFRGGAGAGPRVERSEPGHWGGWRSTHKAVHTQGGAHRRRFVATAGVLLFKGVRGLAPVSSEASRSKGGAAVHTQGGAYTRWCTQKAVCGHYRSLVI